MPTGQAIAPGIRGQILYTAGNIESLEDQLNDEQKAENSKIFISSTERQLLQLLGHASSAGNNLEKPFILDKDMKVNPWKDTTEEKEYENRDIGSISMMEDEALSQNSSKETVQERRNNESRLDKTTRTDLGSSEEMNIEEKENEEEYFSEDTSPKSPTLVAATGIPPTWTKLPLLPPPRPPAANRGSFYNGVPKHNQDHYNTHHRPDYGLSAASIFARIKPHIRGDTISNNFTHHPIRDLYTHKPIQEESEEEYYDDDYSEEQEQNMRNQSSPSTEPLLNLAASRNSRENRDETINIINTTINSLIEADEEDLPLAKTFKTAIIYSQQPKATTPSNVRGGGDISNYKKISREGKIEDPKIKATAVTQKTSQGSIELASKRTRESEENKDDKNEHMEDMKELLKYSEKHIQKNKTSGIRDNSKERKDAKPGESEGNTDNGERGKIETSKKNNEVASKDSPHLVDKEKKVTIIKPGDVKSLLKSSQGESLSEILQRNGLSLPEFLKKGLRIETEIETEQEAVKHEIKEKQNQTEISSTPIVLLQSSAQRNENKKLAFDMTQIKPVSLSDLLKSSSDTKILLKKPSNLFAAIFDRNTTTTLKSDEIKTTTEIPATNKSKWSPRAKPEVNTTKSRTNVQEVKEDRESPITTETNNFPSTKKILKQYSPPGSVGEYGQFDAGRGHSYGSHRPIHRKRLEEKSMKSNRTQKTFYRTEYTSVEESEEVEKTTIPNTTSFILDDEDEAERTKFIDIPVEIRGAIIASSAIGVFALVVFLVIFIILWKRNRKVQSGVRASHLIRRAIENATLAGNGDSETSSTSETIFNANSSYRKNGFWGTLGRSVWK